MEAGNTLILIDNGHGSNTAGKRSPDGRLLEYKYTREIAKSVVSRLINSGYNAELLVPEVYDVPLLERVYRVNVKCQSLGKENVLVVSIHCNAAGDGKKWMNATGWEIWTSEGRNESDNLAEWILRMAELGFPNRVRVWKHEDGERDKEKNFTILKSTLCPAVLTENFFMDSKDDVNYLLSDEGKKAIVNCHVLGVINYIESA